MINIKGRHLLTLLDYSTREIEYLLDLSRDLKRAKYAGTEEKKLNGKNVVILFQKTSTRTRCAFEVAALDQGAHVTYIGADGSQMGIKESIADTARVLGRMYDAIEFRCFKQANNVANSLMICAAKLGVHFVACGPKELWPAKDLIAKCEAIAKETGSKLEFEEDPMKAAKGAHVLYTDIWVSMGEPKEIWEQRIKLLQPYQVNSKLFEVADKEAIFMHCLPSYHDLKTDIGKDIHEKFGLSEMEVSNEVFESKRSWVFEEAENRMHSIKAIMVATLS
jgi:ornithine carbamoyltransferase